MNNMNTSRKELMDNTTTNRKNLKEVSSGYTHKVPSKGDMRLEKIINSILANEFSLFVKTLNFHWNVTGPRFHSIHEFLETQYRELLEIIDDVAERVRKIDGHPIGTLKEFQKLTSIVERPGSQPETSNMIADLMLGHEVLQTQIKAALETVTGDYNDPGTEDFLAGLLSKHENMAWMLRSHLD